MANTTGTLDSFARLAALGQPGDGWTVGWLGADDGPLEALGNGVTLYSGTSGSAYWNRMCLPNTEVWVNVLDGATGLGYLGLRLTTPGSGTTDGYVAKFDDENHLYSIHRVDNGALTMISSDAVSWTQPFPGGILVFRASGSSFAVESFDGSSTWTTVVTANDSTYSSPGYLGLRMTVDSSEHVLIYGSFGGGGYLTEKTGQAAA